MLGLRVNNHPALQPDLSSLFAAYAISFWHTWKNCQHAVRQLSVNLLKLQRGSQAHSSHVWVVMKRLLILTQMLQRIIWYNITCKVIKYCNTFAQMYIYSYMPLFLVVDDYCCNHCCWCPVWCHQQTLTDHFDPNNDFKLSQVPKEKKILNLYPHTGPQTVILCTEWSSR